LLALAASASKCASFARYVHITLHFTYTRNPPHVRPSHTTPQIIELPLLNPELFQRVGIKPPKGVLLYGPPGTGKTLLARAVAATLETNFLKVVSSAIVDKYIGESARVVREMFGYARDHEPCVIFMDEIDAIGGRRFSEGTSADREIQRTLMEVLSCPSPAPSPRPPSSGGTS
jgi:ATP-dependent protease HslVU (ClpYQ) ATPase subunit